MLPISEQDVRRIIREELSSLLKIDRYVFEKKLQIFDGINVQLSSGVGSQFGTETTQKIGFLGKSPVARQSTVTAPSGGTTQDAEARTAINQIKTILTAFGFTA